MSLPLHRDPATDLIGGKTAAEVLDDIRGPFPPPTFIGGRSADQIIEDLDG